MYSVRNGINFQLSYKFESSRTSNINNAISYYTIINKSYLSAMTLLITTIQQDFSSY